MSVIQSTQPELRYSKRQNLENEAKVIGNYYRDLIRSYGIDCIYHKLDTSDFANFKNIVDQNTILKHAYGYNDDPDYSMSAHTLTYMEVENDIFQLNKFGLNPNADVNFYFENNDFACALATKAGQFKEYPIKEIEMQCEVPECTDEYEEFDSDIDPETGKPVKHYLSANVFPYNLGSGYNEYFYCENLSGKMNVEINGYEVGKETTVACNPYEHTDFNVQFDSNSDLYKSMKHVIENDDYLETMLYLTFKVDKVAIGKQKLTLPSLIFNSMPSIHFMKNALKKAYRYLSNVKTLETIDFDIVNSIKAVELVLNYLEQQVGLEPSVFIKSDCIKQITYSIKRLYSTLSDIEVIVDKYKYILNGKIHGNVLFFDVNQIGKYAEKIHPSVGDIVTIDFPDNDNCERYEITDCFDKQLTQDGISPLLHKYIWKCKARRYVDSESQLEMNEADKRLQEKKDYQQVVNEEIAKSISIYDDNEDAAYGGYEYDHDAVKNYDKQDVRNMRQYKYEELAEGKALDIFKFKCGSKLCTDGYSLYFINIDSDAIQLTINDKLIVRDAIFESNTKWLKASKDKICFINIEGQSTSIAHSDAVIEINIEDLYDVSLAASEINNDSSFITFSNCKTYMFATDKNLYAKFESDGQTYQIV